MGFFATPERVVDMVRERLQFPAEPFAALDPCAGEGAALAQLCAGTSARTYGIEPDAARHAAAAQALDSVLHSTIEEATISHQAFSLIYLNPPYDQEHEKAGEGKKTVRKEITFLRRCLPLLAPRGVLVFVVPRHIFTADNVAYLSQKLDRLEIWDFPEPEREQFGQAIAIGTRSTEKQPNATAVDITAEPPATAPHVVPTSNPDLKIWRTSRLTPAELAAASQASPLWRTLEPNPEEAAQATRRPPLPLHAGHLSMLLAAGCLDGIIGTGPERHLVRGKTAKAIKQTSETTTNAESGSMTTTTRRRDKYAVALKVLTPQGDIRELL